MPAIDQAKVQREYRERQKQKLDQEFNQLQAVVTEAALLCERMGLPHHTHAEVIESLHKMKHWRGRQPTPPARQKAPAK